MFLLVMLKKAFVGPVKRFGVTGPTGPVTF